MFDQLETSEWIDDWEGEQRRKRYKQSSVGVRTASQVGWDSSSEREFAAMVVKYLKEEVEFSKGQNVRAQVGVFRPDMVMSFEGRLVGLEVDGKAFHTDLHRDRLRESALLAGRFVNVIYRFAASATWFRAADCVFALSRYESSFFDPKAREVLLPHLASERIPRHGELPEDGITVYSMIDSDAEFDGEDEPRMEPRYFSMRRYTLATPVMNWVGDWITSTTEREGAMPFDQLVLRFKREVPVERLRA